MGLGANRYFVMSGIYVMTGLAQPWIAPGGGPDHSEITRLCRQIKGERRPGNHSAQVLQESVVLVQEYLQEAWSRGLCGTR